MKDVGARRLNRLALLLIAALGLVGCAALGGIVAALWARVGQQAAALELAADLASARARFDHYLELLERASEDTLLEARITEPQVITGTAVCIRGSAERLLNTTRRFEAVTAGYAAALAAAGLARADASRPTFRGVTVEVRLVPPQPDPADEGSEYGVYLTFAEPALAACLR